MTRPTRLTQSTLTTLASRATDRDRSIALDCYQHRVLTTHQLQRLHFTGDRQTRMRLSELRELRVLDRFRPPRQRGEGSAPSHWVLDEVGAALVAQELGLDRRDLAWRRDTAIAIARSAKLAHHVEANEFVTRLAQEARRSGATLIHWWGERRSSATLGGIVAPDAYVHLDQPHVEFFLELDRGTEDHGRLRDKARRYAKALRRAERTTPVLLLVPSAARAGHARAQLPEEIFAVAVWTSASADSPLSTISRAFKSARGAAIRLP